jgi:hypothetical protein
VRADVANLAEEKDEPRNRRVSDDTASYAPDCVASADMNLPRLVASCALFAALLAAMTCLEDPLPREDLYAQAAGDPQSTSSMSGYWPKEAGEC